MKNKKTESRFESRLESTDRILKYFSDRKKRSIENSLLRPLYQEICKSLFIIFSMMIDVFIPLQLLLMLSIPINYVSSLSLFIILLYVELRMYGKIWGKKGIWSIEKYR